MTRPPIRTFAPASVSNVACGFDTLGFSIEGYGDLLTTQIVPRDERSVLIGRIEGDGGQLPTDPRRNTAAVAAAAVQQLFALTHPELAREVALRLDLEKRMPLSSGLGSSAASAVAGAVGASAALAALAAEEGSRFSLSRPQLLECALAGELIASGGRHADNVAPSLIGGFVLVRCLEREPDVVELPNCSDWLWCALARPALAIDTLGSRQRLGQTVPLRRAIRQWANVGALVAALYTRDLELLQRALVDHIAEPARKSEVPGFDAAIAAAQAAGALGGSLSGSGPTLFAIAGSEADADAAAQAMAKALDRHNPGACATHISPVGAAGAHTLAPGAEPGQ